MVYLGVNMMGEVYGKKGREKSEEEVLEVGGMDWREESVEVWEKERGLKMGNER